MEPVRFLRRNLIARPMSVAAARAQKRFNWYVFRSWRILTLLAAVVLLLMTALQTFCSVYPCESWFGSVFKLPVPAGGEGR